MHLRKLMIEKKPKKISGGEVKRNKLKSGTRGLIDLI
jgi:hypothetical protein